MTSLFGTGGRVGRVLRRSCILCRPVRLNDDQSGFMTFVEGFINIFFMCDLCLQFFITSRESRVG